MSTVCSCGFTLKEAAPYCPACGNAVGGGRSGGAGRQPISATKPPSPGGGATPLVLGLLAFFLCMLLAPVAWYLGAKYERECQAAGVQPEGTGTAGKILGMIGTALLVMAFLAFGVIALIAIVGGAASSM